jgi:hypothetical protein
MAAKSKSKKRSSAKINSIPLDELDRQAAAARLLEFARDPSKMVRPNEVLTALDEMGGGSADPARPSKFFDVLMTLAVGGYLVAGRESLKECPAYLSAEQCEHMKNAFDWVFILFSQQANGAILEPLNHAYEAAKIA